MHVTKMERALQGYFPEIDPEIFQEIVNSNRGKWPTIVDHLLQLSEEGHWLNQIKVRKGR